MAQKKFGLISKPARDKASVVARPLPPNTQEEPVLPDEPTVLEKDVSQSQLSNEPAQPVSEPIEPISETQQIDSDLERIDQKIETIAEPPIAANDGPASLAQKVSQPVQPVLITEPPISQGKNQNLSRKTPGRKKKYLEGQEGPPNAARITKNAHKLLNMINSITGQTHAEIIDELLTKHPLYTTLKPILKITLD